MDVTLLAFDAASADGLTILEVLEHLERPDLAPREAIRVARRPGESTRARRTSRARDSRQATRICCGCRFPRLPIAHLVIK